MKLIFTHLKFQAQILLRTPGYLIPTLIFPTMLYCFLGGTGIAFGKENYILASLAVYGVLGVGIYQFGASIAAERESPFSPWQKTLQGATLSMLIARILMALFFAIAATTLLFCIAPIISTITLDAKQFISLFFIALVAMVPSILIGMSIGYLCSAKVAIAIANLIYLPLAFLGGLLINPNAFSGFMAKLSNLTITRQLGELAWSIVGNYEIPSSSILIIALYILALSLLVFFAIKRDQNKRFG